MDKQRLNLLINNPELLSQEDFNSLLKLQQDYPYMQGLHPLLVISSKVFDAQNYKKSLQTAAIYSLDRTHLKNILSGVKLVIPTSKQESKLAEPTSNKLKNSIIKESTPPSKHLPDSFFNDFYAEMEDLKKSKEAYHKAIERLDGNEEKKTKAKKEVVAKKAASSKKEGKKVVKKSPAAKKSSAPAEKKITKKPVKKKAKPDPEHQSIIEEIKLKEIKAISDEHLMEQINLITSFIEKEPSINKKMLNKNVDAKRVIEDLSESSTHLSDDVISETLAKLMIKQGRKEKAIDIYKKLIWKFPQKKAYFADQIKNLKIEE